MKTAKNRITFLLVALLMSASAQAATTCIANKKTGQFETADKSRDAGESQEACSAQISLDLLASFAEAESSVEAGGTKVLGGVIVTNRNDATQTLDSALNAKRVRDAEEARILASKLTTWEILESDVTLQNTLSRWGKVANWEVNWVDTPEIRNPGYVKLPDRDFLSAADYVLSKAKSAAKAAGIEIFIKAYPNRVLVISKEVQK